MKKNFQILMLVIASMAALFSCAKETPGGGTVTKYDVKCAEAENGKISASATQAEAGTTITLTATPAEGYKLKTLNVVTDVTKKTVSVDENYMFKMPAEAVTVNAEFEKTSIKPFNPSLVQMTSPSEFMAENASENLLYAAGSNPNMLYPAIWNIGTGEVKTIEGTEGFTMGAFHSVNNNGIAVGYMNDANWKSCPVVYDGKDISVLPVPGDYDSSAYSVSEDGGIIAGYYCGENWKMFPCIWINKTCKKLDLPSKEETGFEIDGGEARFMSRDGNVIVGFVQDSNYGCWSLVYWKKDGAEYKCVAACEPYFRPQSTGGRPYMRFEPASVSANGEWVSLIVQKHVGEGTEPIDQTARLNIKTDTLEVTDEIFFNPWGISNDGTCTGTHQYYDSSTSTSVLTPYFWTGGGKTVTKLSDKVPQLSDYNNIHFCWIAGDNSAALCYANDTNGKTISFIVK